VVMTSARTGRFTPVTNRWVAADLRSGSLLTANVRISSERDYREKSNGSRPVFLFHEGGKSGSVLFPAHPAQKTAESFPIAAHRFRMTVTLNVLPVFSRRLPGVLSQPGGSPCGGWRCSGNGPNKSGSHRFCASLPGRVIGKRGSRSEPPLTKYRDTF
jgi:hypothetical protein